MFYNGNCSMWRVPRSIEKPEELASSDITASVLKSLMERGHLILDSYLESAQKTNASKGLHSFRKAPSVWPLNLAKLAAGHLPSKWKHIVKQTKIELLNGKEANAVLRQGHVGIMKGTQNLFYACCFAGAPFEMWCHEVDARALTLGNKVKEAFGHYLTARSDSEKMRRFGEAMVVRSELALTYPRERAEIEQIPAGCVNEMLMFYIMHELAHKLLKHKKKEGKDQQEQELEADELAVEAIGNLGTIGYSPLSGALSMSFFETSDRLGGTSLSESERVDNKSTHPPHWQRRLHILQLSLADINNDPSVRKTTGLQLAIQHVMHSNISSILVREGYEPLTPFYTPSSVFYFGTPCVPEELFLCEENVVRMELKPYEEVGLNQVLARKPIREIYG